MKKSIKITIPEPCHEDWAEMTPTQKGKHCAVCDKEVIDFTKATDEQLYKTATNGGSLCGRFTKDQLDRDIQLQRKHGKSWASYAASLLIPAAILSTQEITAQGEIRILEHVDSTYTSLGISSLSRNQTREIHDHRESEALKQNKSKEQLKQKTRVIKGTVTNGVAPIEGAIIQIERIKKYAHTNASGDYIMNVSDGDILIVEALGYEPIKIIVDYKTEAVLNIKLKAVIIEHMVLGRVAYDHK